MTAAIECTPDECWRALTDATLLVAWLPGLRRVSVIAHDAAGLPAEVQFEFSTSLSYSLLYTYDHATHEMRWEPRMGKRDAVRGYARVDAIEGDATRTALTYAIEQGSGRSGAELELGSPGAIVEAFGSWIATRARRHR